MRSFLAITLCVLWVGMAQAQTTQVESFEGAFANEYFIHELDFTGCCFDFVERIESGSQMLHLFGNSDAVHFSGRFDEFVHAVRVDVLDFEGGGGTTPTSVLIVAGLFGDFVFLSAAQIGVLETLEITENTRGQFTGFAIGPIHGLRLQSFAEGNSVFPSEVGGYFDNLTAEVHVFGPPCPGDLDLDSDMDLSDLSTLLSHFGTSSGAFYEDGDVDLDGDIDLEDSTLMLSNFGAAC